MSSPALTPLSLLIALAAPLSAQEIQESPPQEVPASDPQGQARVQEGPELDESPERRPNHTSLKIGLSGNGVCFGNSRRWEGLRLNFRDDGVRYVRGINLTLGVPGDTESQTVDGIALGFGPVANKQRGISLGVAATVAHEHMGWLQVGGLAAVSEGDMDGLSVGGLATVAEGDLQGIQLGGLATVATGAQRGVSVGGLSVVTEGSFEGIGLGGLAQVTEQDFDGVGAAGLAHVTEGSFRGIGVAGLALVAEEDFEGVGIAGLAAVSGSQDGAFWSWEPSGDEGSHARGILIGGLRAGGYDVQGVCLAGLSTRAHDIEGISLSAYNVVTGTQRGLSVGLFNHAHALEGVQIGLLNHVSTNPWPLRWLPLLNIAL